MWHHHCHQCAWHNSKQLCMTYYGAQKTDYLSNYLSIYIYKLMKSTKIISYSCVIWFSFGMHHIMSLCHNCTIINIYKACHMQYYWYVAIDSIALWFVRHLKFDAIHSNNDPHYFKSLIERYSKLNLGSFAHTLAPKVTWSCHRS